LVDSGLLDVSFFSDVGTAVEDFVVSVGLRVDRTVGFTVTKIGPKVLLGSAIGCEEGMIVDLPIGDPVLLFAVGF